MKQLWQNVKNCLTYMMAPQGVIILFPSFKNTVIFHNKKCLSEKKEKLQNAHERETTGRISDTHWDGNHPLLPATPQTQRCSQVGYSAAPVSKQRTVSKLDGWYQVTSST